MKIHFLVNSLAGGGAERVLVLLANHFEVQGHDVSIITFNNNDVWRPNETIKRVKLYEGWIKNEMIRNTLILKKYYFKTENRPDVLIPFMTRTNLIGIVVGRFYRIKVIACEHINHLSETDSIEKFARNYVYRFADAVTCLTSFDVDYYKNRKVNVHVIPNPSTYEVYKENIRRREKIILSIGDLDRYHHKGFDNLIFLIAPVLKKHKDWKLKLVGGGQKGIEYIKQLTKSHDIESQVIFEGFSNEVHELMRDSEIYILSSRFEGLPMVLIEAMSQGMACLAFDCITGPSDIINQNSNGILVENQNLNEMAKELENLMVNPEKRVELSKQAVNSLYRFKIETIYSKFMDLIEDIRK